VGIPGQHQAQDGGQQQQQREQRQQPVVGDQGREVAALVIDVLIEHRQREAGPRVLPLVAV